MRHRGAGRRPRRLVEPRLVPSHPDVREERHEGQRQGEGRAGRVRLAQEEPIGFRYRPPATAGTDDVVAAEARVPCLADKAQAAEVRVVDSGGNLLPCSADGPDARGLFTVTFPARRTIAGQLASPIQDGTKAVTLSVGRDKAVAPGTRFYAMAGAVRIATLEVTAVEAKSSTATVVEKTTPNIAQGIPVESDVVASADYFVYYGNPKPEGEAPRWSPAVAPVTQFGWRITDGSVPTSLDQLRATMRNSPSYVGSTTHSQIDCRSNPLRYDAESGYHVSVYESYFRCDIPGLYRFAVDSGAPAFVLVDGKLAAQRHGFFYQTVAFEHRGKLQLDEGYHHLLLCAVESGRHHTTRLAWQPITATVFSLIPPSFFLTRIGAEVVGYETQAQRHQVFFAYKLAPLSVTAEGGRRYQFVQFQNLTTVGAETQRTYRWDFGDRSQSREAAPGHLYELSEKATSFPVTLDLSLDGKPAGQYKQTVYCDPRPAEKLNLSLELVNFPNIVYYDERASISVRLCNTGFSPLIARAIGRMEHADARDVLVNQELRIEGKDENFCVIPVDMKQLEDKTALVEIDILLGAQRVLDTAARVVPFSDLFLVGKPAIEHGALVLGPGGPYTGVAWAGQTKFPTMNYEVAFQARPLAGRDLCHVTFPVGSAFCTLRPRAWNAPFDPRRWHELRIRVSEGKVEALLDGKTMADLPRSAAQTALPLAHEALKPFGLHAAFNSKVAVRDISLTPIPAPGSKPDDRKPKTENLFDGSLRGWKAAAESDLNLLQRGLGGLYDAAGRRVLISAPVEDPDRHLRWVFLRYLNERYIASRRSILLFGDRMANPTEPGKKFTDYVTLLGDRLGGAKRDFQFVERSSGLLPTLHDVVLFARSLQAAQALPHVIVISLGLADVQQAVGDRDFVRSLDLMIDAVRAASDSIKLVIVSPPPCPRNVRISRLYTEAAERLAREHRVKFLNLDSLLAQGQADWLAATYGDPGAEGIMLANPNEAAHRRIADAIEKLLK